MNENNTRAESKVNDIKALGALAGAALLIIGALFALAWLGMSYVSTPAARAWALIATLLLPVTGWACYRLGSRNVARADAKAAGMLEGIEAGVGKVMAAASQTADLRVHTVERVRQVTQASQPTYAVLQPPTETIIVTRPQIERGRQLLLE